MQITEVRIKLVSDLDDRLRAFCSITIDGEFVVRDLKIIQGQKGHFVAMPSRKIMESVPRLHCQERGQSPLLFELRFTMPQTSSVEHQVGRSRLFCRHCSIPINSSCRERIESDSAVLV